MSKYKISFPHMADYYVPVRYLLSHLMEDAEIMVAPPITSKTIELGSKYSPDFLCTPFKYTLGTMIEALECGANVIVQAGGGCRYGYYSELQIEILKELGYDFTYLNLVSCGKTDIKKIYQMAKKLNPHFSVLKACYYGFITIKMVKYMDQIDHIIRENIGFEVKENSFIHLKQEMLEHFSQVKTYRELFSLYHQYKKKFLNLEIKKPKDYFKVGMIGELYTIMEPFANYQLEYELAKFGIAIKRYTNVQYLLFEKKHEIKKLLRQTSDYIKYKMGADASDNIAHAKYFCTHHYDGIIHIKSSFCTPEIGAMPVISKVCSDYQVPVLFFSFDANTSEVGIRTRIEAFYDMLEMRREYEKSISRN